MLNSETKRRIDSCRDVLVGKLPLPTDMDVKGKRIVPGAHLPGLFRDIFRNAFLKFRDGRILTIFLTEVNGFAYSHSEELGNAFEYVLQCMGTQDENGIVDSVADYIFDELLLLISEDGANLLARSTPIVFSVSGKIWVNNHVHVVRFADMATQRFVGHYLNSISIAHYVTGAAQPKLNQAQLNAIEIPLPPLTEQRRLVAELDAEAPQMEAVRALHPRFEAKIQCVLDRVWGHGLLNSQIAADTVP